jgi:DnaB-like helicase C terminal domain
VEVARYLYHDASGKVVYEVVRHETDEIKNGKPKKFFTQERILENGERLTGKGAMDNAVPYPYMLPHLLEGIKNGETVYFVEGEKCATTRLGGAQAPLDGRFLEWFRGCKEIIVCADCDSPGRQAAVKRAQAFKLHSGTGCDVRIIDLCRNRSDGYDVADFFAEGNTLEQLLALCKSAPVYDPPQIELQEPVNNGPQAARIFTLSDLLRAAVSRTEAAVENGPRVQSSPWGSLNIALGGNVVPSGFSPQETVIWAAVPGGGKSAATWMVADHAAAKHEGTAVIASIEMGEIDAVQRLISLYSGITTAQLRSGSLSSPEWEKLAYTEKHLAARRLAIIGRDGRDFTALHKALESIRTKSAISCIVVDHLGKILQGKSATRSRNESMEDVIEALANLAIEYDCVVHVVQHLNRLGYGQRPTLANLRDGGNTEGHANIVIFPYRKFPNSPQQDRREAGELILEKCRDGFTGSLPMRYVGERYMWLSTEEDRVWFESE